MSVKAVFDEFTSFVQEEHLPLECVAIADGEEILCEVHFEQDVPRNIYSHTKSYMATAVGIAIDEGLLTLDTRLIDLFPEAVPENADERLSLITLRSLLTMSSGFGKGLLMGADRRAGAGYPDYIRYMLSQPMMYLPGSRFDYSTADSILAGRMVEKVTGKTLGAYLYEKVFSKLGQGWPIWETDTEGHQIGGGGMFMRLSDMLKIGQVYLNGGTWHGQRIVSADWVKQAGSLQISTGENPDNDIWRCGYGYQFWLLPYRNAYRADGAYGQITAVLPEQGLVISFQSPEDGDFSRMKQIINDRLFSPIIGIE